MTQFVETIDGLQTKGSQEAGFAKARKAKFPKVTGNDVEFDLLDPFLEEPAIQALIQPQNERRN